MRINDSYCIFTHLYLECSKKKYKILDYEKKLRFGLFMKDKANRAIARFALLLLILAWMLHVLWYIRTQQKGGDTMIHDKTIEKLLITIKDETVPALGCTEPVAVAYAASAASKYLNKKIDKLEIKTSKNIFKNGKSVIIPNTKEWGLDLAGILGFIAGNPEDGLMIFGNITKKHIDEAHEILKAGKVNVDYLEDTPDVYVEINAKYMDQTVKVVLENTHNHISRIEVNEETVYENNLDDGDNPDQDFIKNMSFKDMIEVAESVPIDLLAFIEDGIEMNKNAAESGISIENGLNLGEGLMKLKNSGKLEIDAPVRARILTATAADLRMGGGNCPVMTSSGSGNQGLGIIIPIMVVAEENGISRERLKRAVFLAHVVNKYVKLRTGKLSAICGCAIGAGVGASAAISWMLGGNYDQIRGASSNILANLSGMICDGAKDTCALKLSTSAEEAVIAAYLANNNVIVKPNVGIIGESIERTIENLGILCREGFVEVDSTIMKII